MKRDVLDQIDQKYSDNKDMREQLKEFSSKLHDKVANELE